MLSESGSLGPGLPAALQAAGLADKVKIVGQGGNQQVYQDVGAGKIAAVMPSSLYGYDYSMLDALARKLAGAPVAADLARVLAHDEGEHAVVDQRPGVPDRPGLQEPVGQAVGQDRLIPARQP